MSKAVQHIGYGLVMDVDNFGGFVGLDTVAQPIFVVLWDGAQLPSPTNARGTCIIRLHNQ